METNFSPIENYPFLSPFIFTENPEELEVNKEALLKQLEEVWRPLAIDSSQSMEYLTAREKVFAGVIEEYYREQYKKLLKAASVHTIRLIPFQKILTYWTVLSKLLLNMGLPILKS